MEGDLAGKSSGKDDQAKQAVKTPFDSEGSVNTEPKMSVGDDAGQRNCIIALRDVEESLETFDGETSRDVSVWIRNFEDIARVCGWGDVHKYLYVRRLLRGAAKLSVEASSNVHSFTQLKEHLVQKFGKNISSLSIHHALEKRKKAANETYLEYLYFMKQIASKGSIDEESLIMYIIAGIADDVLNKTVLYEAKTLDDLKQKLKVY